MGDDSIMKVWVMKDEKGKLQLAWVETRKAEMEWELQWDEEYEPQYQRFAGWTIVRCELKEIDINKGGKS